MKNLVNRAKYVCGGEEGLGAVEVIIMVGVALLIGAGLWFFGDKIVNFLTSSGNNVDSLDKKVKGTPWS